MPRQRYLSQSVKLFTDRGDVYDPYMGKFCISVSSHDTLWSVKHLTDRKETFEPTLEQNFARHLFTEPFTDHITFNGPSRPPYKKMKNHKKKFLNSSLSAGSQ